ncbi:MAG TPA: hypothetical protein PKE69_17730, partial [Pyrinomonadaceae bacterium]|nr:hypothetical protein [Pyrinomonadaceae bacterium]
FSFTETPYGGLAGGGVNENWGARISFANKRQWNYNNLQASFENTQSILNTLIHELIHVAFNGVGDIGMQDKLYAAGEQPQTFPRSTTPVIASMNWDSILDLQKHCGFTFKEFSNWWRGQ